MACPLCGKKVAFGKGVKISITAPRLRKCKLLNVDKYDHRLYVCYDHFDPKDHVIKKGKIVGLVKGATPITNLKKDMPDETKSREEIEEAQLNVLDLISVEKLNGIPFSIKLYLCRYCRIAFETCQKLNSHLFASHSPLTLACKKCSKVVTSEEDYQVHKKFHYSRKNIYACSICMTHYKWEFKLMFHMAKVHEIILAFFCKRCSICFTNGRDIMSHIFDKPCRENFKLNLEYIGMCDASQIKFQPATDRKYVEKVSNGSWKTVNSTDCRHKCLITESDSLVTCLTCNCLMAFTEFQNTFNFSEGIKTILAEDEKDFCNSPKNFIDILLDLSTHNVSLKKPPNKIRI